jgi:hypothetical protein
MDGPGYVAAGESRARLRLSARPDADPTPWRLAAEAKPAAPRRDRREMALALGAQVGAGGARRPRVAVEGSPTVASPFVPLDLAPATIAGRFTPAVAEQGKTVTVTLALEAEASRPGPMTATLEGLPPRAIAEPVVVPPGAGRVEFRVAVAATTPAGEHAALVCRLEGEAGGQPLVYHLGRGGVLKVCPPGAAATDASGRPISPLDALRREATPADAVPTSGAKR